MEVSGTAPWCWWLSIGSRYRPEGLQCSHLPSKLSKVWPSMVYPRNVCTHGIPAVGLNPSTQYAM